jgi:hypothetical protein
MAGDLRWVAPLRQSYSTIDAMTVGASNPSVPKLRVD